MQDRPLHLKTVSASLWNSPIIKFLLFYPVNGIGSPEAAGRTPGHSYLVPRSFLGTCLSLAKNGQRQIAGVEKDVDLVAVLGAMLHNSELYGGIHLG